MAYTKMWKEVSLKRKRYLNCQKYGYKIRVFVKIPIDKYYSMPYHFHQKCINI